jgi:hypothetical protein
MLLGRMHGQPVSAALDGLLRLRPITGAGFGLSRNGNSTTPNLGTFIKTERAGYYR